MISAIIEGLSVYFVVSISGMFMGIGMIILLFMSTLRTIRDVHNMEVQRQQRALEKRRQQTERLSLQMMQTLLSPLKQRMNILADILIGLPNMLH